MSVAILSYLDLKNVKTETKFSMTDVFNVNTNAKKSVLYV